MARCVVTEQQIAELKTLHASGDADAFHEALRRAMKPGKGTQFLEAWKAGLLYLNPPTHLSNLVGNSLNLATDIGTTLVTGALDPAVARLTGRARERYVGEAMAQLSGIRRAFGPALSALGSDVWDNLRGIERLPGEKEFNTAYDKAARGIRGAGQGTLEGLENTSTGKFDIGHVGSLPGRAGGVIRGGSFGALESADRAFKRLISEATLHKEAYRDGKRRGLSGEPLAAHISRLVAEVYETPEKHPAVVAAMQHEMKRLTFQEGPRDDPWGHATRHVGQILRDLPILQVVLPFYSTPANIARASFELTPLGAIAPLVQLAKGLNSGSQSERLARAAVGTSIASLLYVMARQGYLTGSGATNPQERDLQEASGRKEYSFRYQLPGDEPGRHRYLPFGRFEPVSSMASIAADLAEASDEQEKKGLVKKLLAATTNAFTSKTFLSGFERLFTLWSDPFRYGEAFARQQVASLIPSVVGTAARALDDTVRDPRGNLLGGVEAKIPGASGNLPPRRTGLGEDVTRQGNPLLRFLSPAVPSQDLPGPLHDLEREMVRLHYAPAYPDREVSIHGQGRVELTREEHALYQESLQRAANQAASLIKSRGYDALPDDEDGKVKFLKKLFDGAREQARARIRQRVVSRIGSQPRTAQARP